MRKSSFAVLALLLPGLAGAQALPTCTRVGSKVTIATPGRDTVCVLKSGAVSYQITVAAAASPTSPTAPTETTVVVPTPPTTAPTIAFTDFESGLGAGFNTPWPNDLSVIADPTGAGRGKVLQIAYKGSGSVIDINRALYVTSPSAAGDHFFVGGDVYFPASTPNYSHTGVQRKLMYLSANSGAAQVGFVVLKMWGGSLAVEWGNGVDDIQQYGLAPVSSNAWHHVEVEVQINSSFAASDGALRIWLDGTQVYERVKWRAFTRGVLRYDMMGVGYQREGTSGEASVSEIRYWDRVGVSSARIP